MAGPRRAKRSRTVNSQNKYADESTESEGEPTERTPRNDNEPKKLGPNPTPPGNCCNPREALSTQSKLRAKLFHPLGDVCVLTHIPYIRSMPSEDSNKVNLMHFAKRALSELETRRLEFILGKEPNTVNISSALDTLWGTKLAHDGFDHPHKNFAFFPDIGLLREIAIKYGWLGIEFTPDSEPVDLTDEAVREKIGNFWEQPCFRNRDEHGAGIVRRYGILPLGFETPITRLILDDDLVPTGGKEKFTAPYADLFVDLPSSLGYVVYNLALKALNFTQDVEALNLTDEQAEAQVIAHFLGQLWSAVVLPKTFYEPPVPLLDEAPELATRLRPTSVKSKPVTTSRPATLTRTVKTTESEADLAEADTRPSLYVPGIKRKKGTTRPKSEAAPRVASTSSGANANATGNRPTLPLPAPRTRSDAA